jgi:hypothetical protein
LFAAERETYQSLNRQVIVSNVRAADDAATLTRVLPVPEPDGNTWQDRDNFNTTGKVFLNKRESMINLRANTYLLAAGTILLLVIAVLCSLAENSMDIFFLGAGIFSGVVTINLFKKLREENNSRSY